MASRDLRTIARVCVVVLCVTVATRADAATRYVADTGSDGPSCGLALTSACRSITQAIALAAAGDTIIVGPGRYGDRNRNGVLGDIPGEETGAPGCDCVLLIHKNVILVSSAGAAVTTIDGTTVDANETVLLMTDGGEFGRPGKGFTVTETARYELSGNRRFFRGSAVLLDAANVIVRGNQFVFTRAAHANTESEHDFSAAPAIGTVSDAPIGIRIEGNLVTNWDVGIVSQGAAVISKNQVINNKNGISAYGGTVSGNVATGNRIGIEVLGSPTVVGNAVYKNRVSGIYVGGGSPVISKNNLFGNADDMPQCGLWNGGVVGLKATNNYWGNPAGPGTLAGGDAVCHSFSGTTTTSPFATKPFAVKIIKP
jgi:parallel beta-helix repeat protein